jgi:hypothetical protein
LSVESFDAADNRSAQSEVLLVTVDQTAPVVGPAPDLLASSDSGMFFDDDITRIREPAFFNPAGTSLEPNVKIRVTADGGGGPLLVGQGVVTSFGTWEITVEPLDDGVYSMSYVLEDLAGNVSTPSPVLEIVVDTVAPNHPVVGATTTTTSHAATSTWPAFPREVCASI